MVLQLVLRSDCRCRLAMPSLHVPRTNLSWHWDPDALARWYTLMPTCRLVSEGGPCSTTYCWRTGLALGTRCGKARSRLKEWIMWYIDYYRAEPQQVKLLVTITQQ